MVALLHQRAGHSPPAPSDEPWPELPPPDELWPAIRAHLPDDEDAGHGLRWPLVIASLVGVLIGILLSLTLLSHLDRPLYRADLSAPGERPALRVDVHPSHLDLRRLGAQALPADGQLRLWLLPDDAPPLLLGALPAGGTGRIDLAPAQRAQLQDGSALQITPPTPNGAAEPQPTGPVLYRGNLHPQP